MKRREYYLAIVIQKVILMKSTLKRNKSLAFSTWLFPLGKSTEPMNIYKIEVAVIYEHERQCGDD